MLVVLAAARADQKRLSPSRFVDVSTPFERELPDLPLTLIVRTNASDSALICEVDVLGTDGVRRVYGRSHNQLAVIVYSENGGGHRTAGANLTL